MNLGNESVPIVRRFALDAGLWYCVPTIFMAIYTLGFSLPLRSLAFHALVMAVPLAGLILARLGIARWVANGNLAVWIAAVLTGALIATMIVYYCLVIGGLRSWGGIISWSVISGYARQAPALAATFGFAPLTVVIAAITAFVALLAILRIYLRRFDWTRAVAGRMSAMTLTILLVCGYGILGAGIYQFCADPWTQHAEPVSLTLFQDPLSEEVQGHAMDRITVAILDRKEGEARAAYSPAAPAVRRNLVLIVIDAQRPDHMGIYGYARDTTPNLCRLARTRPVRKVESVHSSCADTACGLLSLSSSKFPRQFSFRPFTLQQVMRRNGYSVHMILGGDHTRFYGLKRFYGEVDTFYDGAGAQGYFMNDDKLVQDRLAAMPPSNGTPAMFQFHLMSTHMLGKHADADAHFEPAATYVTRFRNTDIGPGSLKDETATNYYDNGVLKSDRMVQSLLGMLEEKGYMGNTLVVITADHGEALGEHGMFVHMNSVREEVLRIPLLMISYGYEPERALLPRPAPAQVDIAPTILAELGLPVPANWSGRALQEPQGTDFIHFEEHENIGLIDRRDPAHLWKYWSNARTGAEHAFDLSLDPGESRDVPAQGMPDGLRDEWRRQVLPGRSLVR